MTLSKNSIPGEQLKRRRFSETSIMIEYNTIRPYFMNVNDELPCCPQDSSSPNDDIWKKFELLPTPPRSPQHSRDDEVMNTQKHEPIHCSLKSEGDLDSDVMTSSCLEDSFILNNSEDTTTAHYDKHCDCSESTQPKLIKDCMWNGVGHKTIGKSYKTSRTRRTSSPASDPTICHASGCVDPRNIFPYPVGKPLCCDHQTCRTPASPAQKPRNQDQMLSDSEEEIDVVTVESKSQSKSRNQVAVSNRLQVGQKIMGTLVSKENGLTLVTNSPTNFQSAKKLFKQKTTSTIEDRGRARSKQIHLVSAEGGLTKQQTVAMLFDQELTSLKSLTEGKQVKLHLKNLPVVHNDIAHRRHTVEECHGEGGMAANTDLMIMANPKSVMKRSDSVSPVSRSCAKKRILSLDGISFSSTAGHRQYTNEYNRTKELQQQLQIKLPTTNSNALSIPIVNSASLKTAQELAISVTARNKTKPCKTRGNEMNDPGEARTRIAGSPQNKRKRKADVISTSSSSSNGSGSDNEQIRAAHNVLERQRREGLRTSFHTLRDNVPELRNMEKTPKVNILNKARDYCIQITELEKTMLSEKSRLQRRNYKLQQRLQRVKEAVELARAVNSESDIESEMESETSPSYQDASSDGLMSPESSLPPSPPSAAPQVPAAPNNRYIFARYLQAADSLSKKGAEVLLCRETSCDDIKTNGTMRITGTTGGNKTQQRKQQVKYVSAVNIQSIIANLQQAKKVDGTNLCRNAVAPFQTCEALSDGYEENYDSEEEIARYAKTRNIAF